MAESSSAAAAASSPASSSRVRVKNYNNMGEIVEVQGGHIVRSTGRKDRHSKVCTAKGPRDRRVRLSAHTAIQFYDVQDRLGYDRPSKAVDWLIKKAKAAIDQLDQLPAWNPIPTTTTTTTTATANHSDSPPKPADESEENLTHGNRNNATASSSAAVPPFLPPSMDSDSIADTIKSFFPIASGEQQSNASHHHHQQLQIHHSHQQHPNDHHHQHQHHHHHQSQDLRLSLQSLQDTIFHQNNDQSPLFSGTTAAAAGGWSDGGGGFAFNSLQDNSHQFFSTQRGPLQSSNTPSVRANNNWIESQPLSSMADHHNNQISHSIIHHNQSSSSFSGIGMGMGMGMGFATGVGFSGGFHHFPARIRGEEEHHGGGSTNKPSSDSSDSRH